MDEAKDYHRVDDGKEFETFFKIISEGDIPEELEVTGWAPVDIVVYFFWGAARQGRNLQKAGTPMKEQHPVLSLVMKTFQRKYSRALKYTVEINNLKAFGEICWQMYKTEPFRWKELEEYVDNQRRLLQRVGSKEKEQQA